MLNPDPQAFETEVLPPPQVFTRVFSVPAGLPWVQVRAARLEARHGAPLPISELMHQLRRLGRWSPGEQARFVVFYLRAREFRVPFETSAEVDGQLVKVAFGVAGQRAAQVRRTAVLAAAAGSVVVLLALGLGLAFHARGEAEARLALADQRLAARVHAVRNLGKQADLARAVVKARGAARPVGDVLADFTWAAAAKAPEARIVAVHWDHGLLAVEARGETAPFGAVSRTVERSPKPIRSGVWLWGVRPDGAEPSEGAGP